MVRNEELNEVIKELKNEKQFRKLLEKICKDFNINNSEEIINNFIEKQH